MARGLISALILLMPFHRPRVEAQTQKGSRGKTVRITALAVGALVFLLCPFAYDFSFYAYHRLFKDNLHPVVTGQVYRAAQMPYGELAATIDHLGIKTIIDLRKGWDEGDGSTTEPQVAEAHGAKYVRIRLSARMVPPVERLRKMLETFKAAERPVLIHCSDGTHRTGFASFLWLVEVEHRPPAEAIHQLSLRYGYFRADQLFKEWRSGKPSLGSLAWEYMRDYTEAPEDFFTWAEKRSKSASFDGL